MKQRGATLPEILVVVTLVLILLSLVLPGDLPLDLLIGWAVYPYKVVPEMKVEPAAVAVSCISLVLLITVVHRLASWLFWRAAPGVESRKWKFRWTLTGVGLTLFLFAAGIALIATRT